MVKLKKKKMVKSFSFKVFVIRLYEAINNVF